MRPDYGPGKNIDTYTTPPRLIDNHSRGYAKIYDWKTNPIELQDMIHDAFLTKKKILPDNSFPSFVNNRTGARWYR